MPPCRAGSFRAEEDGGLVARGRRLALVVGGRGRAGAESCAEGPSLSLRARGPASLSPRCGSSRAVRSPSIGWEGGQWSWRSTPRSRSCPSAWPRSHAAGGVPGGDVGDQRRHLLSFATRSSPLPGSHPGRLIRGSGNDVNTCPWRDGRADDLSGMPRSQTGARRPDLRLGRTAPLAPSRPHRGSGPRGPVEQALADRARTSRPLRGMTRRHSKQKVGPLRGQVGRCSLSAERRPVRNGPAGPCSSATMWK